MSVNIQSYTWPTPPYLDKKAWWLSLKASESAHCWEKFPAFFHLHISHNTPCMPLKIFCITFGFHFSWVLVQPFREELKTMLMQNFEGGGGRGANKVSFGTGDVQVANYLSMEDIK